MEEKNWLLLAEKNQLASVTKMNQKTEKFGLVLSNEEAKLLVTEKTKLLQEHQRVELGESILPKLIFTFCDSPYIYQDNYVETISRLTEIFFLFKNETMDRASDDELLDYMKEAFDGECQGSLEHLEDTCLVRFAEKYRKA